MNLVQDSWLKRKKNKKKPKQKIQPRPDRIWKSITKLMEEDNNLKF